jgi:uncharacterized protein (TIGR02147 family)
MPKDLQIFLNATSSSELLANLFRDRKTQYPKTSLASICARAGIPSRGNLNDVLKGRRMLNKKYSLGICRAFGLSGFAAEYLRILIELESASSDRKRDGMEQRKALLRKILSTEHQKQLSAETDHAFCFQLFASFGLFSGRPTEKQLKGLYSRELAQKIDRSLAFLVKEKCIEKSGDVFIPANSNIMFRSQDWLREFLQATLREAERNLETRYSQQDRAVFESSYISVDEAKLAEALPRLREAIEEFQASVETTCGNNVIQFSMQVFPIHPTLASKS